MPNIAINLTKKQAELLQEILIVTNGRREPWGSGWKSEERLELLGIVWTTLEET